MAEDLLAIRKGEVLDDAVVHFKCVNLEKALRKELNIPDRPIMRKDLTGVTELNLDGGEITDLITDLFGLEVYDSIDRPPAKLHRDHGYLCS